VQSHGEPQVARAPQRKAEKHSDHEHAERADFVFAAVAEMKRAERAGERRGRRPETDSGGKRELRVAAK
jgi:hypothetical protein